MTSRRGFLGLLGAGVAGMVLDPERLLWVPGAKTISIPAPSRMGKGGHWVEIPTSDRNSYRTITFSVYIPHSKVAGGTKLFSSWT